MDWWVWTLPGDRSYPPSAKIESQNLTGKSCSMLPILFLFAGIACFVYLARTAIEARRLHEQGVQPDQVPNRLTRSFVEARVRQEGLLPTAPSSTTKTVNVGVSAFLGVVGGACASYLFAPTTLFGKPSFMQWMTEGYQVDQFRTTIFICAAIGGLIGAALGRISNK